MSYTFRAHGMEMEASYDTEDTPASRHHHHAFARAKDTSAEIDTSHEDSIHVAHPRDALFDGEEDEDLGRRMFNNKDYEDYSDEEDVDFLKAIYERTVDGACRSVNLQGPCMISIDDQLDLFTHCRQPLSFLSFFREHHHQDNFGVEVVPAGAYVVPTFCEYCGAARTTECGPQCSRPGLYFQKLRPPFCKRDPTQWAPNDHALPRPTAVTAEAGRPSWVAGLFGRKD